MGWLVKAGQETNRNGAIPPFIKLYDSDLSTRLLRKIRQSIGKFSSDDLAYNLIVIN